MSEKKDASDQEQLQLAFITISDQEAIKDPQRQQLARTQAIKHSLQRKRRQRQLANENFINQTITVGKRSQRRLTEAERETIIDSQQQCPASLASAIVDPFETLAVDANRLTQLLRHSSARQAGDPVFSVHDSIEFQGLRDVFNAGLEDPGLGSAVSLVLAFAANGGIMDRECTLYKVKAIQHVNEKLSDLAQATSNVVLGIVLLLTGVEARLGERETAQMHLNGMRQLLLLCNERKAYISHAIKRAIFWQDLFTSMIAGTHRLFSHETFPELHWHRDPYQQNLYSTPIGFAKRAEILGFEFIEIIQDICALQHMRENGTTYPLNSREVEKVDNQQAWIESRLEQLRQKTSEPLLTCCIPAAYLCAYGFFTEIWSGRLIPSHLTSQLLTALQASEHWQGWNDHSDVLLWLLNIGAAFATDVAVRQGFAGLWHGSHRLRLQHLSQSWDDIERLLKDFIWSDVVYGPRCGAFWERLQNL